MYDHRMHYFPSRGYGEISRQILVLAGVKFEDVGLAQVHPYKYIPVSTLNGSEILPTSSFAKDLAKKHGLSGKTEDEESQIETIIQEFNNFNNYFRELMITQRDGKSNFQCNKFRDNFVDHVKDSYFVFLCNILKNSESGFLVGDSLTWADLVVADNISTLVRNRIDIPPRHRKLLEFHEKISSIPKLKEWIEKRNDNYELL